MTNGSRIVRFAIAIFDQMNEREVILAEQKVLSMLVEQGGAEGARRPTPPWVAEVHDRNVRRLAEIEGRRLNKLVLFGRRQIRRLPSGAAGKVRSGLGALVRRAKGQSARASMQRPLSHDTLAVPFADGFPAPSGSAPVGVVAHIFYPELADEIRTYLIRIPGRVDLHISTDTEAKRERILEVFSGWTAGEVEVRLAPNRGRDVAPKLITFRDVYDTHPYVLHLHSKKSPHDSHLKAWRYYLYETLMGSEAIVRGILAAFDNVPELGMAAPQHYHMVQEGVDWGENVELAASLSRRMGIRFEPDAPLDFPSGSMFWARSAALRPLLDLGLEAEDFPPELGQADGTLAHAIERLYFLACEAAGFRWIKMARPEFRPDVGTAPVIVGGPDDLTRYLTSAPRLSCP